MSNLRSSGRSAVATPERTEDDTADVFDRGAAFQARRRFRYDGTRRRLVSGTWLNPGCGDADEEVGHDLPVSVPGETQSPAKTSDIEPVPGYRPIAQLRSESEQATLARATRQPLDAWYATYADPATIERMAYRQQELTRSVVEVVIGADDRVRINPTTAYPWRCVCSLGITAANGLTWIGTGWLVAPRTVITAGHCVWMHSQGGRVASIGVMPGRNGSATETPFSRASRRTCERPSNGLTTKTATATTGAILLPESFLDYSSLGTFGYASLSDLDDMTVNLSGYPGDKPTGTQWFHSRKIKNVESRRFYYDIDTAGGQSGAPVWRFKDNERHVVGIHTNGASTGNSAVRITSAVFDNIKTWKHWYD